MATHFSSHSLQCDFAGEIPPNSIAPSLETGMGHVTLPWPTEPWKTWQTDLKRVSPSLSAAGKPSTFSAMSTSPARLQKDDSLVEEGPNHSTHPS